MSTVGLFGRQFTEVGSSSSDFLIKTKGKVKIQWGNKFIDLIKDGKIAVDGFQFYTAANKESIDGDDGFYITDDGGVYIKFGDQEPINIFGEVGTTYVSFVESQETLPEQKLTAQKNIGFIFDTLEEARNARLQNGIAYIADEGKLYTIKDYQIQELTFEFPNPYVGKFVIQLGQGQSCSLLVEGYYDENRSCLVLGKENAGLYLYSTSSQGVVQSKVEELVIETSNGEQILIGNRSITIKPTLICDSLQSRNASSEEGYKLYIDQEGSTLELDNLILRKGITPKSLTHEELLSKINEEELTAGSYYIISDFQNEWELTTADNITGDEDTEEDIDIGEYDSEDNVEDDSEDTGDTGEGGSEETSLPLNVRPLLVQALSNKSLNPKATMLSNPEWEIWYDVSYKKPIKTKSTDEEEKEIEIDIPAKGRIVKLRDQFNNQCNYDFKHLRFPIDNAWVYTFGGEQDLSLDGSIHDNNIVVENYNIQSDMALVRTGTKVSFKGETYNNEIISISHDLITSSPFINNTGVGLVDCIIQEPLSSTYFHGQFTGKTFSGIDSPELGRADKFTDVYMDGEGVKIVCIPDLVVSGSAFVTGMIVMFNGGANIPDGWAICDGTNGTPNLIGSFIKASNTAGETGGSQEQEYMLKETDLPIHSHNITASSTQTSKHVLAADTLNFGACSQKDGNSYTINTGISSENENGYELLSNQDLVKELSMQVSSDPYTQTAIKIEPKYYSLIFIMKL